MKVFNKVKALVDAFSEYLRMNIDIHLCQNWRTLFIITQHDFTEPKQYNELPLMKSIFSIGTIRMLNYKTYLTTTTTSQDRTPTDHSPRQQQQQLQPQPQQHGDQHFPT